MASPWWKDGVRFECQGSGKCCLSRGTHGYVYLTLEDRRRLAKFFRLATAAFTRRYCRKLNGWFHLRPESPEETPQTEGACRFLRDKRCTVYKARPAQCRTWPFWPETMSAKAWDREVAGFCPGVGRGKVISAKEIRRRLKQDPLAT